MEDTLIKITYEDNGNGLNKKIETQILFSNHINLIIKVGLEWECQFYPQLYLI